MHDIDRETVIAHCDIRGGTIAAYLQNIEVCWRCIRTGEPAGEHS